MPRKKKSGSAAWTDPDDAPPLTDAFFDHAEIRHGDRSIRRGRPPLPNPKQAVKLRQMPTCLLPIGQQAMAGRRESMRI